jgi:hypothetical protein
MNINSAFPSKYLKAADVETNVLVTISRVDIETVGQFDDETKPIVYFNEFDRGLVLNKTNSRTIASLYGSETNGWVGRKILLYSTMVDFQGKQVEAIRVKRPAQTAGSPVGNGQTSPRMKVSEAIPSMKTSQSNADSMPPEPEFFEDQPEETPADELPF